MVHLDLFSGIGGFSLGLNKVFDIKKTYFSEIDKYAIEVYKKNFKNSKYVGSVTDIQELPKINIITFGSPCQDFSLAGKRKGMDGERSSLISEAIRLIKQCRPTFFIWENVKGTFSSNSGEDFWAIIQAFNDIGGYRLEWQLLNTKWFLPQNRERIYLVGLLGKGSGQQVFPIPENNQRNNKKQLSRKKTNKHKCSLPHTKGRRRYSVFSNTKKGYEIAKEGDTINFQNPKSKTRRGRIGKGIAQTLDSSSSQCIVSDKIRRLTPLECERLQGFPDNWTKYGTKGLISDTQRYKMCGNAVTVDVVESVAKRIKLSVI
jgi:DNA (cytosine-5)-methyltransferase 1